MMSPFSVSNGIQNFFLKIVPKIKNSLTMSLMNFRLNLSFHDN
ncbi:Uncharacterised protein [Mycobacterium tuberculosis]|nr:Uncharacterised protein [Mycobacterium tuberculosis]